MLKMNSCSSDHKIKSLKMFIVVCWQAALNMQFCYSVIVVLTDLHKMFFTHSVAYQGETHDDLVFLSRGFNDAWPLKIVKCFWISHLTVELLYVKHLPLQVLVRLCQIPLLTIAREKCYLFSIGHIQQVPRLSPNVHSSLDIAGSDCHLGTPESP